jgi:hypothetical protein
MHGIAQGRWFHDAFEVLEQRRITLGELPGAATITANPA